MIVVVLNNILGIGYCLQLGVGSDLEKRYLTTMGVTFTIMTTKYFQASNEQSPVSTVPLLHHTYSWGMRYSIEKTQAKQS